MGEVLAGSTTPELSKGSCKALRGAGLGCSVPECHVPWGCAPGTAGSEDHREKLPAELWVVPGPAGCEAEQTPPLSKQNMSINLNLFF